MKARYAENALIEEFRRELSLDEATGELFWACARPGVQVGAPAGTKHPRGYTVVCLNYKFYLAHRIIWVLKNGPIPEGFEIDHRDESKANNRPSNLRLATRSQNLLNREKPGRPNRSSQYRGVSWYRSLSKWRVQVRIDGKVTHGGYFDTEDDAARAYNELAIKHYGEFAKPNQIPA